MTQRITEAHLRKVIRTELKEMMDQMGGGEQDPMRDPKNMAAGAVLAGAAISPYLLTTILQKDPVLMQKVVDMLQDAGHLIQSIGE